MKKETEAKWLERVREWRESGLSADDFAKSKGYKASTLSWAASLLRQAGAALGPTMASSGQTRSRPRPGRRRASPSEPPRFLPLRTRAGGTAAEMVIEVGGARIRVLRGFDVSLLSEVVRALGGVAR
jgi:hypothetical protein